MKLTGFSLMFTRLLQRPQWITLPLALLLAAYIVWQGIEVWLDRPLPASSVAARQLQVNKAAAQNFSQNLANYRQTSSRH